TTLRAVPSTDESIKQHRIATKAPDKAPPSSATCPLATALNEKLQDAERLLLYAADAGIVIRPNIRDAVLKAKITSAGKWSEQTAANLLSALTTLAAQLKPVTADSLKACVEGSSGKKLLWYYRWITIGLALCIIPFSVLAFITSTMSEAIRKDI